MLQKMNVYRSGLLAIGLALLFPIPLVLTFLAGLPVEKLPKAFGFSLGIYAYVWMLLTLYLSVKPAWISRYISPRLAYVNQGLLTVSAVILSFFHREVGIGSDLMSLTGMLALSVSGTVALYTICYALFRKHLSQGYSKTKLITFLNGFNTLGVLLVVLHVHLIAYVRENLSFIVLFDALTVPIFTYIIYKWCASYHHKQINHFKN